MNSRFRKRSRNQVRLHAPPTNAPSDPPPGLSWTNGKPWVKCRFSILPAYVVFPEKYGAFAPKGWKPQGSNTNESGSGDSEDSGDGESEDLGISENGDSDAMEGLVDSEDSGDLEILDDGDSENSEGDDSEKSDQGEEVAPVLAPPVAPMPAPLVAPLPAPPVPPVLAPPAPSPEPQQVPRQEPTVVDAMNMFVMVWNAAEPGKNVQFNLSNGGENGFSLSINASKPANEQPQGQRPDQN